MTMLGSLEVLMDCRGSYTGHGGGAAEGQVTPALPLPCIVSLLCRCLMWSMDGLLVASVMDRGGIWVAVSVGCVWGSVYVCVWVGGELGV